MALLSLSLASFAWGTSVEKPEVIRKRIAEASARRKVVIAQTQAHASFSRGGLIHLKDYENLLRVRYSDEDGLYTPGAELAAADRENIHTLIKNYLHQDIPSGRISVGRATSMLIEAQRELAILADAQEFPTEANQGELEILSKRIADDQALLAESTAK